MLLTSSSQKGSSGSLESSTLQEPKEDQNDHSRENLLIKRVYKLNILCILNSTLPICPTHTPKMKLPYFAHPRKRNIPSNYHWQSLFFFTQSRPHMLSWNSSGAIIYIIWSVHENLVNIECLLLKSHKIPLGE